MAAASLPGRLLGRDAPRDFLCRAVLALLVALGGVTASSDAAEVMAGKPSAVSVTVYRAPDRKSGSIDLDSLAGFALISETRAVHLPAGVSRLRFAGVADGIEPASVLIEGFPGGVMEKNRDAKLLSPSALLAATVGRSMTLSRTDPKTGKTSRSAGSVVSDADGGVVFQSAGGIEALRCSGLPESMTFTAATDLAATPTLSVRVDSARGATYSVTLSYLARGFDWAADYVATQSADGNSLNLGAWVTLANGNGEGFPEARARVVAGRVNIVSGEVEPVDAGGPILAQCWPRGSTSDSPALLQFDARLGALDKGAGRSVFPLALAGRALAAVALTATSRVQQEQLGDLKLYRIPDLTTVASRQSKQIRFMDRVGIPIHTVYSADVAVAVGAVAVGAAPVGAATVPATRLLRTRNDAANHLGLPLPSGRMAVFVMQHGWRLLQHQLGMRDIAIGEPVEIDMGESPEVQVAVVDEKADLRSGQIDAATRVDVSNARSAAVAFELRLSLPAGSRVIRADHPIGQKNGRPIFKLIIPARGRASIRFQTRRASAGQPPLASAAPACSFPRYLQFCGIFSSVRKAL